jgi:hypothetical protein
MIKVAEATVHNMIDVTIGLNGFFFFFLWNLLSGSLNLRKHLRSKAAIQETGGVAQAVPPTLATNALDGKP